MPGLRRALPSKRDLFELEGLLELASSDAAFTGRQRMIVLFGERSYLRRTAKP